MTARKGAWVVLAMLSVAVPLGACAGQAPRQATFPDKIGVELDSPNEGSRTRAWVDLGHGARPWTLVGSDRPAQTDAHGWPTSDAQAVFFDVRPFPAWNPPVDDPAAFQPDWSGTYHLSFHGQGQISPGDAEIAVREQTYDARTNTTRAAVVVPRNKGLLVLALTDTRRTGAGPANTGVTDLRLIRPGYPEDTPQIYTDEFLRALRPFRVLRFMDWLSTNSNPGFYGDPGHHTTRWSDRHVAGDATQQDVGGKRGVAWEYAVTLANQTEKDVWINIPVSADDDYVLRLARLLRRTLRPGSKIYVEHSNEVWNFGFPQYIYNKLAATDEVKAGHSTLNNDGATDPEVWAHRRHAKRLLEISRIFAAVYGPAAINTTVRPVYASWGISPRDYYADVLAWVDKTYGPPQRFFYALAGAAYFNVQKAAPDAGVPALLSAMRADSDNNRTFRAAIGRVAASYGLKNMQYEVGPDVGGGSTTDVASRILANRAPGIKDVILHDARDNWFAGGGDLYMYFSFCSGYSRYGAWGLSEDVRDLSTPKWQAIYALTGTEAPSPGTAPASNKGFLTSTSGR